jgi:cell division protein FtsB
MLTKQVKKRLTRIVLACEVAFFVLLYLFGAQGVRAIVQLRQDNQTLDVQLRNAKKDSEALQQEVTDWQSDPFYKEKIAREHLHMAHTDDLIVIV